MMMWIIDASLSALPLVKIKSQVVRFYFVRKALLHIFESIFSSRSFFRKNKKSFH